MQQRYRRPTQLGGRGFQDRDSITWGSDQLWDKKIQRELAKMIGEDHMRQVRVHLPKETAQEMAKAHFDAIDEEFMREHSDAS